jgi:hypothetical protein
MMLRTRLVPPYTANGRAVFPTRQRPGVYLIFRADGLRYVGFSASDVYKALYRHFQAWNDNSRDRPRAVYPKGGATRVRVIYTNGGAQAARLERALIIRFRPKDNPEKLLSYDLGEDERAAMERAASAPFIDPDPAPF